MVAVLGEESDRAVISNLCRRHHWEVFFANTCDEARALLDHVKPQVLLMDRDVAGADWRTSMSSLASASNGSCIMLLSRVVDDYLWNDVVCNGGYEVLPKPAREDEVFRAVKLAWSYWASAAKSSAGAHR